MRRWLFCKRGWHYFKEYRSKPAYRRFVCDWCGVVDFRPWPRCSYVYKSAREKKRCVWPVHDGNVHKID